MRVSSPPTGGSSSRSIGEDRGAVKVAVVGTGHVGQVTAVTLASLGHQVAGLDSDPEKIGSLRRGQAPLLRVGARGGPDRSDGSRSRAIRARPRRRIAGGRMSSSSAWARRRTRGRSDFAAVEGRGRHRPARRRRCGRGGQVTVPTGTAERICATFERNRPGPTFHRFEPGVWPCSGGGW